MTLKELISVNKSWTLNTDLSVTYVEDEQYTTEHLEVYDCYKSRVKDLEVVRFDSNNVVLDKRAHMFTTHSKGIKSVTFGDLFYYNAEWDCEESLGIICDDFQGSCRISTQANKYNQREVIFFEGSTVVLK